LTAPSQATTPQAVTRSRRYVVGVVTAVAVQHDVAKWVVYGRIVGHVRGARHDKSGRLKTHPVDGGIADHRAALTDLILGFAGTDDVVAGDDSRPRTRAGP